MMSTSDDFLAKIGEIEQNVAMLADDGGTIADDALALELSQKARLIKEKIGDIMTKDRCLKLGIVGRVKAGKSSFLNALIFGGKSILPKAATPMTASLTRITYDKAPSAKIVFYKDYDWQGIVANAEEYNRRIDDELSRQQQDQKAKAARPASGHANGKRELVEITRDTVERSFGRRLPERLRSCDELCRMAKERGISGSGLMGKEKLIPGDPLESAEDFLASLTEYVGAQGKYTPLVNYIELKVNIPSLEGFEIVDTPGMNDPIVSRVQKTREFLMECDASLVLSNVSQFIGEDDMELLAGDLGRAGVKEAYLIGTMMDLGVRQFPEKVTFQSAYIGSKKKYIEQAKATFAGNTSSALIQKLAEQDRCGFVSSMIFSIARKMETGAELTADERDALDGLSKMFPDFRSAVSTVEDYDALAGIKEIHEKIVVPLRKNKDEIIAERIADFTSSQISDLIRLLDAVNIAANNEMQTLRDSTEEELLAKKQQLEERLGSIRGEVHNVFVNEGVRGKKIINDIKLKVQNMTANNREIRVEKNTETEHWQTGMLFWKKDHTRTITTYEADKQDVIDNLTRYASEAMKRVNDELAGLFDIRTLKERIKKMIAELFDFSDTKFSPDEILLPIETMLQSITIPEISFDFFDDAVSAIYNEFPGSVINEDVNALKAAQDRQLRSIRSNLESLLDGVGKQVENKMRSEAGTFVDKIEKKVGGRLQAIADRLKDRESKLKMYEQLISSVKRYKAELAAM